MTTYRGGCHCGRVVFEVEGELTRALECNCSICSRRGYLHWVVPRERFRLLGSDETLSTYSFGTGVAKHLFCSVCGICSFYVPRSDPDKISVNVRCLEGVEPASFEVDHFDGRNWERAYRERQRGRD